MKILQVGGQCAICLTKDTRRLTPTNRQVIYGDPDLPVTRSRSRLRVRGTIDDIVRNEFGFAMLVVIADTVQFIE